jgi:hypothetical protein
MIVLALDRICPESKHHNAEAKVDLMLLNDVISHHMVLKASRTGEQLLE